MEELPAAELSANEWRLMEAFADEPELAFVWLLGRTPTGVVCHPSICLGQKIQNQHNEDCGMPCAPASHCIEQLKGPEEVLNERCVSFFFQHDSIFGPFSATQHMKSLLLHDQCTVCLAENKGVCKNCSTVCKSRTETWPIVTTKCTQ